MQLTPLQSSSYLLNMLSSTRDGSHDRNGKLFSSVKPRVMVFCFLFVMGNKKNNAIFGH